MTESSANLGNADGFTPLTSEQEKLDQLISWLEEHTTILTANIPTDVLRRPDGLNRESTGETQSLESWLGRVASARQQANINAARLGDEISHGARMVLGSAADQSLPYQHYADGKVTYSDVSVATSSVCWPADFLPRNDGGEDRAPEVARSIGAQSEVGVRIFYPTDPTGAVVIAAHGGSWWMGNGACRDMLFGPDCAALAQVSGAVVLDVDYRLAPEFPVPASVVDLLAVAEWAAAHADELGIDSEKMLLWGTSSGGHASALAAATAAVTGRRSFAGLLLSMPALDLSKVRPKILQAVYGQEVTAQSAFISPVNIAAEVLPPTHVQLATQDKMAAGGDRWPAEHTTITQLLSTHIIATPKVQRQRTIDLATAVLRLTDTERELPVDPDATYSAEAVDKANRESWGPVLRPEDL